eukprot:5000438-Alexandrium_andersonii.AAC.1
MLVAAWDVPRSSALSSPARALSPLVRSLLGGNPERALKGLQRSAGFFLGCLGHEIARLTTYPRWLRLSRHPSTAPSKRAGVDVRPQCTSHTLEPSSTARHHPL